jgi:hypothetical protein
MFWKRKPKAEALLPDPRPHHYAFAHFVLRQVCAEDPLRFFATMASPDRCRFVDALWAETARRIGRPIDGIDTAQTAITTTAVREDCPTLVVTMPPARAAAEAHLVALVLVGLPKQDDPPDHVAVRCFTLECGTSFDGGTRTVLCAWDAENRHLNYGDGPEPTVAAFLAAIRGKL